MPRPDQVYAQLKEIEASLHKKGKGHIKLHQEPVKNKNMKFKGGYGTLCITPVGDGYDVSLSGISLVREMAQFMKDHFGGADTGYIFSKDQRQPYWHTDNFEKVKVAVNHYAALSGK